MDVHPLHVVSAELVERTGSPTQIKLTLELTGMPMSAWGANSLRFYLGGAYPEAANLFFLLNRCVQRIIVQPTAGGSPVELPAGALVPWSFTNEEPLLPYENKSFPGYAILPGYFVLPELFLFFELTGLERWRNRGDGSTFEILFELGKLPIAPPRIRSENFMLFVTPVVNLFPHEADPISIDHRQAEYRIRAAGGQLEHYDIYSVDKIIGLVQGSVEPRNYIPFEFFGRPQKDTPIYSVTRRKSPVGRAQDVFLALTYPSSQDLSAEETLSISLTCTNGSLPEQIRLGDISQPTSTSPELMEFRNIIPPTFPTDPPIDSNMLWHFLSHLSLNYLSLAKLENIKELLGLYIFPEGRDRSKIAANTKRINGIVDLKVTPADRLVSGQMMRGREIRMTLRQDHFASPGDMYLFGSVMDYFFSAYSSMNSFTQLVVEENITGEIYTWPPKIGDRFLM